MGSSVPAGLKGVFDGVSSLLLMPSLMQDGTKAPLALEDEKFFALWCPAVTI